MRRTLLILSLLLLTVGLSVVHAQSGLAPLLILNEDGIFALSRQDGATHLETVVAPPEGYQALREASHQLVLYFSAEWISPDGEILAYRTISGGEPIQAGGDPVFTYNLALLNLHEGGDPIRLTLTDDEDVSVEFDSVAWSNNGAYLYVLIATRTPRQSDPDWTVVVFQRDQWDTPNLISLDPPAGPWIVRNIFAADNAFVVLDWAIRDASHEFKTYSPSGELLNTFSVTSSISPDVNLYANTNQLNPLLIDGSTRFVFSHLMMADMLLYQADLMTGEISEMEAGHFSALVSRAAPQTSLHISLINLDGEIGELSIRDAEGEYIDFIQGVPMFAYGIQGDTWGSTFTVSPDGQALAFLREGTVNIWHDGVLTALDERASVIAWQSPLYVPVLDLDALRRLIVG